MSVGCLLSVRRLDRPPESLGRANLVCNRELLGADTVRGVLPSDSCSHGACPATDNSTAVQVVAQPEPEHTLCFYPLGTRRHLGFRGPFKDTVTRCGLLTDIPAEIP